MFSDTKCKEKFGQDVHRHLFLEFQEISFFFMLSSICMRESGVEFFNTTGVYFNVMLPAWRQKAHGEFFVVFFSCHIHLSLLDVSPFVHLIVCEFCSHRLTLFYRFFGKPISKDLSVGASCFQPLGPVCQTGN